MTVVRMDWVDGRQAMGHGQIVTWREMLLDECKVGWGMMARPWAR